MTSWPVHGRISGPIVMIGFGSIGRGTLPLIERHFEFDKSRFTVIDPVEKDKNLLDERGIRFIQSPLTRDNYRDLLTPLLTEGGGQGFCVNLSVDTSSVDIMELCRELGALYIDTVNEPWAGFYFDASKGPAARTNFALREATLAARRKNPGGPTRSPAAAPTLAWCRGSSSRRCSTSPRHRASHEEPQSREDWRG
jgi:homospermidine synthase